MPDSAAAGNRAALNPGRWLRPGVVVHDPADIVDTFLADFAFALRSRGFNVVGYVQHDDVNLLVISHFSAFTGATDSVGAKFEPDGTSGLPLLTSIAGQSIHKWHSYVRRQGSMIAPDLAALWSWWGPEHLYRELSLTADEVRGIVCGPRWIMVEGPAGVGLAPMPGNPRDLMPRLPRLAKQSLADLAALTRSWNPLETALGAAAMNAHYNRFDLDGHAANGIKPFRKSTG
jgi:hypothetical protein